GEGAKRLFVRDRRGLHVAPAEQGVAFAGEELGHERGAGEARGEGERFGAGFRGEGVVAGALGGVDLDGEGDEVSLGVGRGGGLRGRLHAQSTPLATNRRTAPSSASSVRTR